MDVSVTLDHPLMQFLLTNERAMLKSNADIVARAEKLKNADSKGQQEILNAIMEDIGIEENVGADELQAFHQAHHIDGYTLAFGKDVMKILPDRHSWDREYNSTSEQTADGGSKTTSTTITAQAAWVGMGEAEHEVPENNDKVKAQENREAWFNANLSEPLVHQFEVGQLSALSDQITKLGMPNGVVHFNKDGVVFEASDGELDLMLIVTAEKVTGGSSTVFGTESRYEEAVRAVTEEKAA